MRRSALAAWSPVLALGLAAAAPGAERPPRNPYLADSSYPIGHADSAQSDSVLQAGPTGPTRTLEPDEIDAAPTGPGSFGACTSGPYPDGGRVLWGNGLDRIVKIDHESFEILATHPLPGVEPFTEAQAEASIARFERSNHGLFAIFASFREMLKFRNLAGFYTLLDRDNLYYIGDKSGGITARGDADPNESGSQLLYTIGARENRWTLEALDWKTGASAFHWVIGGQRTNSLFSGTLIGEAGRIHYGGPWSRLRLSPRQSSL